LAEGPREGPREEGRRLAQRLGEGRREGEYLGEALREGQRTAAGLGEDRRVGEQTAAGRMEDRQEGAHLAAGPREGRREGGRLPPRAAAPWAAAGACRMGWTEPRPASLVEEAWAPKARQEDQQEKEGEHLVAVPREGRRTAAEPWAFQVQRASQTAREEMTLPTL